jgi:ABC-type glycerol-3-phosphate transport system substrate-binding protein
VLTNQSWGSTVFINQYAAMAEDGGPNYTWKRDTMGGFDCDVYHPPLGPVEGSAYPVTDGYGMSSGTKWPEAAWEVMSYLAGPSIRRFA